MANFLTVENLKVHYASASGFFNKGVSITRAVDGISFSIPKGKTMGLVGESGSGKSTTGRAIAQLVPITDGDIFYQEANISKMGAKSFLPYRKKIQMIFQDPFGSLNPRLSIGKSIEEPMTVHLKELSASQRMDKVANLLDRVGLPKDIMTRFPHLVVDKDNALESLELLLPNPNLSSVMSRLVHLMFLFRHRL